MHFEKKGLVISDWYFGERMETNGAGEKVKKREEIPNILQKLCAHAIRNSVFILYLSGLKMMVPI